jgi:hypothetical protein
MTDLVSYDDFGIIIPPGQTIGNIYVRCPKCSDERKTKTKQKARILHVDLDKGVWFCNNCDAHGSLKSGWSDEPRQKKEPILQVQRVPQKFYPEPTWNWNLSDSLINPLPPAGQEIVGEYDVTWYYRNTNGKLTSAKKMAYKFNGVTFKRDHDRPPMFLNTRDSGYVPCLFNEYDLTLFPDATVILVEAEKTAALLRYKFHDYLSEFIYLATGGTNGLTDDKAPVLANRKVLICFDCDQGDPQPNGTVKNPRGREHAEMANQKLKAICSPKVIDIAPEKTDGTDLADMLDEIDIEYFQKIESMVPESLKAIWANIVLTEKPPYREPLLTIDDLRVFTPGNHSLILGRMKSRKTLFLTYLIQLAVSQGRCRLEEIQFYDTEQSDDDVWELREKVYKLTGAYPNVFMLRGQSHKERLDIIDQTIDHWPVKPRWVIIDGVRDLMSNINSEDESNKLITWIQKRTYRQDLHITEVLHMNKTDGNARGHIGTELLNRTEITIELELDNDPTFTNVKCAHTRRQAFQPFMLRHGPGPDYLPEVTGVSINGQAMTANDQRRKLQHIFDDGPLKYREYLESVQDSFGIGEKKARHWMTTFKERGWVAQFGKPRHPDTTYRLMIEMATAINGAASHSTQPATPSIDPGELPF